MKITETASLRHGTTQASPPAQVLCDQRPRAVVRAVMGGGWIVARAVSEHVRRKTAGVNPLPDSHD